MIFIKAAILRSMRSKQSSSSQLRCFLLFRSVEGGCSASVNAVNEINISSNCDDNITALCKVGRLDNAMYIFEKITTKSRTNWVAFISALLRGGHLKVALRMFGQMREAGIKPKRVLAIIISSSLQASKWFAEAKLLHACIIDATIVLDFVLATALVKMYGKCQCLENAHKVFAMIRKPSVISWTTIISANTENGQSKEAIHLFRQMRSQNVRPDRVSFIAILELFSNSGDLGEAKLVHAQIIDGDFESDIIVCSSLIKMYGECKRLEDAFRVFNKACERDQVLWTIMMAAYTQNAQGKEALKLFQAMQHQGFKPNKVCFVTVLNACASQGCLSDGKLIHSSIIENKIESVLVVANALLNMYARCGELVDALNLFHKMVEKDIISWSVIIALFGQLGLAKEALEFCQRMQMEGMKPDKITFVSVLTACCLAGLTDEICHMFVSISSDYGSTQMGEHYHSLVDYFGRIEWLDEAEDFITASPFPFKTVPWLSLLGCCRISGDIERGERAAAHVMRLNPHEPAAYVLLSNIYAVVGRLEDALRVKTMMKKQGIKEVNMKEAYTCKDWHGELEQAMEASGTMSGYDDEQPNIAVNI